MEDSVSSADSRDDLDQDSEEDIIPTLRPRSNSAPGKVLAKPRRKDRVMSIEEQELPMKQAIDQKIGMYYFNKKDANGRRMAIQGSNIKNFTNNTLKSKTGIIEEAVGKFMISANGTFLPVWESIIFVSLMFLCFYVPVRITYQFGREMTGFVYFLEYLVEAIFFLDFVVMYSTPKKLDSENLTTRWEIFLHYLYPVPYFVFDLIAMGPYYIVGAYYNPDSAAFDIFDYGMMSHYAKYFRMALLLKFLRFYRFRRFWFKDYEKPPTILKFIKRVTGDNILQRFLSSLLVIMAFIHCFSCLWYYASMADHDGSDWITLGGFSNEPLLDLYVDAAYLTTQTFTTVGYGDIPCQKNFEKCIRIVMIITGAILFSWFTGVVLEYLTSEIEKADTLALQFKLIEKIEKLYKLPDIVKHNHKKAMEIFKEEDQTIIKIPPPNLECLDEEDRMTLDYLIYSGEFLKAEFFEGIQDRLELVTKLKNEVRRKTYEEDEPIYSTGDPSVSFYVLISGRVQYRFPNYYGVFGIPFYEVKTGPFGFFGEFEIINGIDREWCVVAKTEVTVFQMSAAALKMLIEAHPKKKWGYDLKQTALKRREAANAVLQTKIQKIEIAFNKKVKELEELGNDIEPTQRRSLKQIITTAGQFFVKKFSSPVKSKSTAFESKLSIAGFESPPNSPSKDDEIKESRPRKQPLSQFSLRIEPRTPEKPFKLCFPLEEHPSQVETTDKKKKVAHDESINRDNEEPSFVRRLEFPVQSTTSLPQSSDLNFNPRPLNTRITRRYNAFTPGNLPTEHELNSLKDLNS